MPAVRPRLAVRPAPLACGARDLPCPSCWEPLEVSQADPQSPEVLIGACPQCGALYLVGDLPVGSGSLRILGRAGLMEPGVRMRCLDGREVAVGVLEGGVWSVPEMPGA